MPAWEDYKAQAKSRGALAMELFVVQTKPAGDMELVKATLPDHLAYQRDMQAAGSLFLAGPVSDASGENMNAEGMVIYRAENMEAARKIAEGDPMHSTGARTFEIRKWLINEGNLNFSIFLAGQSVEFK